MGNLIVSAVSVVVVATTLAGCSSTAVSPLISYEKGVRPGYGVINESSVGSVMYTEFDYFQRGAAIFVSGYEGDLALGKIVVPPNSVLLGFTSDGEDQYCSQDNFYRDPLVGPYATVCFGGVSGEAVSRVRSPAIMLGRWKDISPVQFRRRYLDDTSSGKKLELIYQGVSGSSIQIAYREYINDLARPAFSQIATYNLDPGGTTAIQFKGVKISVLEANNNVIRYIVESGFEE